MRKNDPPAPTEADFRAVNAAPAAVWVSTPSAGELSAIADPTSATSTDPTSITTTTHDRSRSVRELVLCMRRFAGQAYDTTGASILEDCGLKPTPWNSTDVMKVWDSKVAFAGASQVIVVAFAGTRMPNAGDVLRDLQSQFAVDHDNPLDRALPGLPSVGSGWDARWYWQAKQLKGALDWYLADAKAGGKMLDVYLVGHSLGAVTATLAGYDVTQYLRARAEGLSGGYRVHVYAFNPPRLGGVEARDLYQDALFASRASCPARAGQTCLVLRQFTRSADAVQSVPVTMRHPVWSTPDPSPRCAEVTGDGKYSGRAIGYCTQINAPALSTVSPLENHQLAGWDDQIMKLGDAELIDGMFKVN